MSLAHLLQSLLPLLMLILPSLFVPPLSYFGYFSLPLAISFSQSSVFLFVDFILFSDSLKDPLLVSSGGGTSWP